MNSNRISYGFGNILGIMAGIMIGMANACTPPLTVTLYGPDEEWVHVGCHLSVDSYASGGLVGNWIYYVNPTGVCSFCSCQYWSLCGGPPESSCGDHFPNVGTYTLYVAVDETTQLCFVTRSASDSKTVYAVNVDLSPDSGTIYVGGDRVGLDLIVEPAGPTAGCYVILRAGYGVKVWDSQTDGNLLFQGGSDKWWPVGTQPSKVWLEGTGPTDDCVLDILYRDPYGNLHPGGCTPNQAHFTISEPPVVVTDDCWGIVVTQTNEGTCECETPSKRCFSDNAELRSAGLGKLTTFTRTCAKVPSGSYGRTQCGMTSPPQLFQSVYACKDEMSYEGVVGCAALYGLVCTVQCAAAASACATAPGSWECIDAAQGCYDCLTGQSVDCGCLPIECGNELVGEVWGDMNGVYGERCKRP